MATPIFHPALDDIPDQIAEMHEDARAYGVSVDQFCACVIWAACGLLTQNGSSSKDLDAALERARVTDARN